MRRHWLDRADVLSDGDRMHSSKRLLFPMFASHGTHGSLPSKGIVSDKCPKTTISTPSGISTPPSSSPSSTPPSSTPPSSTPISTPPVSGSSIYTTSTTISANPAHTQAPYPATNASSCGGWTLVDNVCAPSYCTNNNESESCSGGCPCGTPPSADCKSGTMYPEVHAVSDDEPWHYSVRLLFNPRESIPCLRASSALLTSVSRAEVPVDLDSTVSALKEARPPAGQTPGSVTPARHSARRILFSARIRTT